MKNRVQENKPMDLGDFFIDLIKNIHNPEPFIKESINNFFKDLNFIKEINSRINILDNIQKEIINSDNILDTLLKSEKKINIEQESGIQSLNADVLKQKEINLEQDLEIDQLKNTHIIESYFITDPKNIKKTIGFNDSSIRIGLNKIQDWNGDLNSKYKNNKGNIGLGQNVTGSLAPDDKINEMSTLRNIAIGNGSLGFSTKGNFNTMCGHNSAIYLETGIANTGVGYTALMDTKSGSYNSALGSGAGTYNNGSYNTFLGRWAGRPVDGKTLTDFNWTTCVGSGTFATNSNQVILGTEKEHVYTAFPTQITTSDDSLQKNIADCKIGLDFINRLKPIEFELDNNSNEKVSRIHLGLSAKDVKKCLEDLGLDYGLYQDHSKSGGLKMETVSYMGMTIPMINAIKELNQKITSLQDKIDKITGPQDNVGGGLVLDPVGNPNVNPADMQFGQEGESITAPGDKIFVNEPDKPSPGPGDKPGPGPIVEPADKPVVVPADRPAD